MIRTERMFKRLKTADEVLHCLDTVLNTYSEVVSNLTEKIDMQTSKPLITIDIGSFGTDSYTTFCPEYTNYTEIVAKFEYLLSNLYSGKWTLEQYESTSGLAMAAKGVEDSGYITGLQRVLASRARCLVLYGAGCYRALTEYYYRLQHRSKREQCIYRTRMTNNLLWIQILRLK